MTAPERKKAHPLAALKHRNFRLYQSGQCISLIGTSMQRAGQAWLVLIMQGSPFQLGLVGTVQMLPVLFLGLIAGVVADRVSKRKLILVTQSLLGLQALALAALAYSGQVQYWHILALAFAQGVCTAFDNPARRSLVYDMVGKEDLVNALALSSALASGASIIGPAIGGLTMDRLGPAMAFFFNGISYFFVVAALLAMDLKEIPRPVKERSFRRDIGEGIAFARQAPVVRDTLLMVGLVGIFGLNYDVLIPVLAKNVLQQEATGYGVMMSFMATGALLGAVTLAFFSHRVSPPRMLYGGAIALAALQLFLAIPGSFTAACAILFISGWAETFYVTAINTNLQINTPDQLRGRIMSLFTFLMQGTVVPGHLFAGSVVNLLGAGGGFLVCGTVTLMAAGLVLWLGRKKASGANISQPAG